MAEDGRNRCYNDWCAGVFPIVENFFSNVNLIFELMIRKNRLLLREWDTIGMFVLMSAIFSIIVFYVKSFSDIWLHADGAYEMLINGRLFASNFLMYFMANLLSGFSGNINGIRIAMVFLIAMSETAKYYLTKRIFAEYTNEKFSKICSCALMFVYVIPIFYLLKIFGIFVNTNTMYLGYYVPNVWHNSTILCSMPFAIGIYWLSVKQFKKYDVRRNYIVSLLVVICVLIKPSFFFIYAVSYPIMMLVSYRFSKTFVRSLLPILCGILVMAYEYFSIYGNPSDGSSVVIDFSVIFNVSFWKSKIKYLIVSFVFLFLFIFLYWEKVKNDKEFWFVILMVITSVGISYVCKELGPRANDGNFDWQVIPATWFVYYYILKTLIADYTLHDVPKSFFKAVIHFDKTSLMLLLYVLHTMAGVFYLLRFLITKSFI